MKNLSLEKQDKLMNEIIRLEMIGFAILGYEFWENEESKQELKEHREEFEKNKIMLMSLLDDEGKAKLKEILFSLDNIEQILKENSFNNGVRSGLTNLSFLKEYFDVF